jgi:hypothetical protein
MPITVAITEQEYQKATGVFSSALHIRSISALYPLHVDMGRISGRHGALMVRI